MCACRELRGGIRDGCSCGPGRGGVDDSRVWVGRFTRGRLGRGNAVIIESVSSFVWTVDDGGNRPTGPDCRVA